MGDELLLSPYEAQFLDVIMGFGTGLGGAAWKFISKSKRTLAKYAVYAYFRSKKWVVRDGSGFGFDFVLYEDHPEQVHSRYCVAVIDDWNQAEKEAATSTWVAWSVKKEVVFAVAKHESGLDISTPSCIAGMKVETVVMTRGLMQK